MRKIRKAAEQAGWEIYNSKGQSGGHQKWRPPDPAIPIVVVQCTPCQGRGWENLIAQLRRSGLKI